MWKKQLRPPLSAALRSAFYLAETASPPQLAAPPSSSRGLSAGAAQSGNCHFLKNPEFFGRKFCSESVETVFRCWNCKDAAGSCPAMPFLACPSCHSVQPIDRSVDYFQIFGLKKKYEIGDENLEGKYKDWQKKLHPDLVHSKSQKERDYAAEQSARVIDAYRTLTDPLSRAMYIVSSLHYLQSTGMWIYTNEEEGNLENGLKAGDLQNLIAQVDWRMTANGSIEASWHSLENVKAQLSSALPKRFPAYTPLSSLQVPALKNLSVEKMRLEGVEVDEEKTVSEPELLNEVSDKRVCVGRHVIIYSKGC
ncbi:hypothetical protein RJ639_025864 [Escallonia herrerae]|uniref:J domain-containing protein n=1 Tax=Escallonia herrerae TaxID=1293975 RepID=A0AA88RUM3_9ASTE|nr:hypothetical protein RJ639_025864 [Escallonia herrerae]